MVFNSWVFLLAFLPLTYGMFWLARTRQQRYVLLAISGYVFYGWWNWRYCFLLLFSSLVSYGAGRLIESLPAMVARRRVVVAAVAVDLGLLGYFKYYNFFASSLDAIVPGTPLPLIDVVLPIGISFYTFHTISYVVDVYAGRVRAAHNLFEYFTYVALFSQLVAGPIVRFRQIEADLESIDGPPRPDWTATGVMLFTAGMFKKVVIADHLAQYVDPALATWTQMGTLDAWLAALGYTAQLYFDFSGYSDMAVGLGYLFMLRIPPNFDSPYRAAGIADFWRRWHISLSSWLRDYLYIPLGGSRRGELVTYRNLLIVMLLGGLWHGANWTFVVWGAYHGLLLSLERLAGDRVRQLPLWSYRGATFLAVVIGWVFFRSTDLAMAAGWLGTMFSWVPSTLDLATSRLVGWLAVAAAWIFWLPEPRDLPAIRTRVAGAACAIALFLALLSMSARESVFLYYQF